MPLGAVRRLDRVLEAQVLRSQVVTTSPCGEELSLFSEDGADGRQHECAVSNESHLLLVSSRTGGTTSRSVFCVDLHKGGLSTLLSLCGQDIAAAWPNVFRIVEAPPSSAYMAKSLPQLALFSVRVRDNIGKLHIFRMKSPNLREWSLQICSNEVSKNLRAGILQVIANKVPK